MEVVFGMGTSFAVPCMAGVEALFSGFSDLKQSNISSQNYPLTFSVRGNCEKEFCGEGILLAYPITQMYPLFNYSSTGLVFAASTCSQSATDCGTGTTPACGLCTCNKYYYRYSSTRYSGFTLINTERCWACASCSSGNYWAGCDGNTVIDNRQCYPCLPGEYSSGAYKTACTLCPAGSFAPVLYSASCTSCTAGFYSGLVGSSSSCSSCLSGTYSNSGASVCYKCTTGKYSQSVSAISSATCLNCSDGYYSALEGSALCTQCPQNSYCPSKETTPTLCPVGSIGAAAGTSTASNCVVCLPGTYSDTAGASACDICTPGDYCLGGSNIPVTCSSTPVCVAPQYIKSCTATSNAQCADCDNNLLPSNSHWMDNQLDNCVWACNRAPAYYFKTGTACQACKTPSSCLSGTYVTTCTLTADGGCTSCNNKPALNSYYTSNSPQYDISSCDWSCDAGYKKEANACVACGTGTYSLQGVDTCSICLAGTFTQLTGQSTCSVCPAGTFSPPLLPSATVGAAGCTSCTAGTYSYTESSTTCLSCSPTGYTPTSGATACTPCPVCTSTGDYRKDCAGTLRGTCEKCTNTT